jgi:triphosphoribosyl-dephospho-CoA synthase
MNAVGRAFVAACEAELRALKPGNVHLWSDGHRMTVTDFRRSAAAAAPAIADPALRTGRRIRQAVEATARAVGQNTNLGIVLLAAPLAQAAHRRRPGETLASALRQVLAGLDVADARDAFRAIRLAHPAGLGRASEHDVADEPHVSLLEAMRAAADQDSIARQYATGFSEILEGAVPLLLQACAQGWSEPWAVALVYLDFLGRRPDSHLARKHGPEVALAVSAEALGLAAKLAGCEDPASLESALLAFDRKLKVAGLNPGTSADLTVATHFAAALLTEPGLP